MPPSQELRSLITALRSGAQESFVVLLGSGADPALMLRTEQEILRLDGHSVEEIQGMDPRRRAEALDKSVLQTDQVSVSNCLRMVAANAAQSPMTERLAAALARLVQSGRVDCIVSVFLHDALAAAIATHTGWL